MKHEPISQVTAKAADLRRALDQVGRLAATINAGQLRPFAAMGGGHAMLIIDPAEGAARLYSATLGAEISAPLPSTGVATAGFKFGYLQGFARQFGTLRMEGAAAHEPFLVLGENPDTMAVLMPMRASNSAGDFDLERLQ